jgi:hypothetical protein
MSDYYEFINIAISFSILLMVVLLIILSAKKFRKRPASYWVLLILLLLGYYFFTLFQRYGWFDHIPLLIAVRNLIPLAFAPTLFLLFSHFLNRDFGPLPHIIKYFSLLIIFILGLFPYLLFLLKPNDPFIFRYSEIYIFMANIMGAIGFLLVSIWAWIGLRKIKMDNQSGIPTAIKFHGKSYNFIRLMVFLILSHGIVWMIDIYFSSFHSGNGLIHSFTNSGP